MMVDAPSSPDCEPPTIGGTLSTSGSLAVMLGSHSEAPPLSPLSPLSEMSQSPFARSFAESFGGTKDSKDSKTSEDEADFGDAYQFASQDSRMMLLGMRPLLVSLVEWFGISMDMPFHNVSWLLLQCPFAQASWISGGRFALATEWDLVTSLCGQDNAGCPQGIDGSKKYNAKASFTSAPLPGCSKIPGGAKTCNTLVVIKCHDFPSF